MPFRTDRIKHGTITVDGVVASEVAIPVDAQAAADTLAEAAARGKAVTPVGGGTALTLGNPPERVDLALSTENLSGIIDYEPTDLVLSVGAGARFGDVQAVLAEHGQRLPLDPPGAAGATIGGLIATGRWGPLRYSAGTLRDLLIGISVAHPSGTVSKAGGMVVKNVSGYDMPRLYLGSLGTLGVVVSANFKVLPRPRAEATVIARYDDLAGPIAVASRLRSGHGPLAALEVLFQDSSWALAMRIEGRNETVDAFATQIVSNIEADVTRLDGQESATWWSAYVDEQQVEPGDPAVVISCGVRPKETSALAGALVNAVDDLEITLPYLAASPGVGVVVVRLDLGDKGYPEGLAAVQRILFSLAETVTILAAPPSWKSGIDVWGRLPEGFEVMQALRHQFDPLRTINPGRFAGFL